jgi:FMN phosphatase YigB (HAD superfamily)
VSGAFDLGAAIARLTPGRPLLIVDADEVILRFVDGFDRFLRHEGLFLDLTSYRLHGNVKRLDDRTPILDVEVTALLDDFRRDLDSLEIVEGAFEALTALKPRLDIVMLTNIAPAQGGPRLRNLATLGLDLPLVANSGVKGPAVKALAARAGRPAFFVDDIPQNLASAAQNAPDVYRIHLIGDERLKPLLPPAAEAHLRAEHWRDAEAFIAAKLTEAGL